MKRRDVSSRMETIPVARATRAVRGPVLSAADCSRRRPLGIGTPRLPSYVCDVSSTDPPWARRGGQRPVSSTGQSCATACCGRMLACSAVNNGALQTHDRRGPKRAIPELLRKRDANAVLFSRAESRSGTLTQRLIAERPPYLGRRLMRGSTVLRRRDERCSRFLPPLARAEGP